MDYTAILPKWMLAPEGGEELLNAMLASQEFRDLCKADGLNFDAVVELIKDCSHEAEKTPGYEGLTLLHWLLESIAKRHCDLDTFINCARSAEGLSDFSMTLNAVAWWKRVPPVSMPLFRDEMRALLTQLRDGRDAVIATGLIRQGWNPRNLSDHDLLFLLPAHIPSEMIFRFFPGTCVMPSADDPAEALDQEDVELIQDLRTKLVTTKLEILREAESAAGYRRADIFLESALTAVRKNLTFDNARILEEIESRLPIQFCGIGQLQAWIADFSASLETRYHEKVHAVLDPFLTNSSALRLNSYFDLASDSDREKFDAAHSDTYELLRVLRESRSQHLKRITEFFSAELSVQMTINLSIPIKYSDMICADINSFVSKRLTALQASEGSEASGATASPPDTPTKGSTKFLSSPDYRSISWNGIALTLTPKQARVVKALHEAYLSGVNELSEHYLTEELLGTSSTMREIFRNKIPGTNKLEASKAWELNLIVNGSKKGMCRLNI